MLTTAPYWSLTAVTRTPASERKRAASAPTLPKPCTAAVERAGSRPACRSAASAMCVTPRLVALARPCEPPSEMGLPVTMPGTV